MIEDDTKDLILKFCEAELRDVRRNDQEKVLPEPHAAFLLAELQGMLSASWHKTLPMGEVLRLERLVRYVRRHSSRRQVEPLTEVAAKWAATLYDEKKKNEKNCRPGQDVGLSKSDALDLITKVYLRVEVPHENDDTAWDRALGSIRKVADRNNWWRESPPRDREDAEEGTLVVDDADDG